MERNNALELKKSQTVVETYIITKSKASKMNDILRLTHKVQNIKQLCQVRFWVGSQNSTDL